MSAVYPAAVTAIMTGGMDLDTDTIMAQLTEGYTYDATDSTLADVGAGLRVGAAVAVTVTGVTDGEAAISDVVFDSVEEGHTIDGVVFYKSAGGEASPLLCHIDKNLDTTPMAIVTSGADVTLKFARWLKL